MTVRSPKQQKARDRAMFPPSTTDFQKPLGPSRELGTALISLSVSCAGVFHFKSLHAPAKDPSRGSLELAQSKAESVLISHTLLPLMQGISRVDSSSLYFGLKKKSWNMLSIICY